MHLLSQLPPIKQFACQTIIYLQNNQKSPLIMAFLFTGYQKSKTAKNDLEFLWNILVSIIII